MYVQDHIFDDVAVSVFEGSAAHQHLICEDAEAPDVYGGVVLFLCEDLR